jgi:MFS family permease
MIRLSEARLAAAWRGSPFAVRDFRLLSVGQFTSTTGDYCYAVALPWLVLSNNGGPVLLGTVLACYGVARTALIPVGGVVADRLGPAALMLTADAVRCVLVAALAALAARHAVSLALLGPVAVLLGAGEGVFLPASFSIMPTIVNSGQLAAGNSLSTAMVQVGSLAGPVLGGLVVSGVGTATAFAVDAATFAVSAGSLALIRAHARSERPANQLPDAGPEAGPTQASVWSLLRRSLLLQTIVLVCVAANLASGGTFEVALPALARESFGAAGYGALIACFGGGAVAGTLVASRAGSLHRPAFAACGAYLVEATAIGFIPFLGGLAGATVAILVAGVCNGFGNIVLITLLQQWAPQRLLGRVMSLVMLAGFGTFPASVAVAGVLVRNLGPDPFFPVAGGVLCAAILFGLTRRELREFGVAAPSRAKSARGRRRRRQHDLRSAVRRPLSRPGRWPTADRRRGPRRSAASACRAGPADQSAAPSQAPRSSGPPCDDCSVCRTPRSSPIRERRPGCAARRGLWCQRRIRSTHTGSCPCA